MPTLQDKVNYWTALNATQNQSFIDQNLNSMFLYNGSEGNLARVRTYKLSCHQLAALLNINGSTPNNQLRVHLAGNPAIPYGQTTSAPSFSIILDAYHLPANAAHRTFNSLEPNSIEMEAVLGPDVILGESPSVLPEGAISMGDANIMDEAYKNNFPALGAPSNFTAAFISVNSEHPNKLVNGFVVGSEGVDDIVHHLRNGDGASLYIHLGYLPSTYSLPNHDWFRFRSVLQINGGAAAGNKTFYYDFAKPCPPACGGGFVEAPLENTIN